jgi:hypothetical protein
VQGVQGLGRPSPIGLKHSAIALSGDSEPITHLHTPPARGCARVCKGVQMGAALTVGGEPASCSGDPAGSMRLAALRRSAAHRTVSRAV